MSYLLHGDPPMGGARRCVRVGTTGPIVVESRAPVYVEAGGVSIIGQH